MLWTTQAAITSGDTWNDANASRKGRRQPERMVAVESKQVVDPETSGNVTRHAVMGGRGSPHLPAVVDQFTGFQSEKAA